MVAAIDREVTIPGVGVYHPRTHWLEGAATRVSGLDIRQSVNRLTVHVHQPEELIDALTGAKMANVRECRVNYINGFHFPSLKRALDEASFEKLALLRVTATNSFSPSIRQIRTLRSMHRRIARAKLIVGDRIDCSQPTTIRDEVVRAGDGEWFRHYGGTIALYSTNLPWFDIASRQPDTLEVDCDDAFHTPSVEVVNTLTLNKLVLHNVSTSVTVFLNFLSGLNVRGLRTMEVTTGDDGIKGAERAIRAFLKTKGVSLIPM